MTPSERSTLITKLGYLQDILPILAEARKIPKEKLLSNRDKFTATLHDLQTVVESLLDCSQLLVLVENWRPARSEREAIELIADHSVIPRDLAKRLLGAKGFRNLVVHEYAKVDPEKVYENLQSGFPDLEQLPICWDTT